MKSCKKFQVIESQKAKYKKSKQKMYYNKQQEKKVEKRLKMFR